MKPSYSTCHGLNYHEVCMSPDTIKPHGGRDTAQQVRVAELSVMRGMNRYLSCLQHIFGMTPSWRFHICI